MRNHKHLKWSSLGLLFVFSSVMAEKASFGDIASNLFTDASFIQEMIQTICIITGICFLLGSVLQYRKHRQNPTEVRIGTPIMTLITGLALIALSFIPFQI